MLSCIGCPTKQFSHRLATNSPTNWRSFSFVWVGCVNSILGIASTAPQMGLKYRPMKMNERNKMNGTQSPEVLVGNLPQLLSHQEELNPGLCFGKPMKSRLSYVTCNYVNN